MKALILHLLAVLALLSCGSSLVQAQQGQLVTAVPAQLAPSDASGAIATGGTFQSLFAAAGSLGSTVNTTTGAVTSAALRRGCVVINTSATVAYVFAGAIASATTPKSTPLNAATAEGSGGGSFSCERGDAGTLQTQISIVGATAGKTFFAIQY